MLNSYSHICLYKGNYAYWIKNYLELSDPNPKIIFLNKTTINTENFNSFKITLVKGSSLNEFEKIADKVIGYLEKVKISIK